MLSKLMHMPPIAISSHDKLTMSSRHHPALYFLAELVCIFKSHSEEYSGCYEWNLTLKMKTTEKQAIKHFYEGMRLWDVLSVVDEDSNSS